MYTFASNAKKDLEDFIQQDLAGFTRKSTPIPEGLDALHAFHKESLQLSTHLTDLENQENAILKDISHVYAHLHNIKSSIQQQEFLPTDQQWISSAQNLLKRTSISSSSISPLLKNAKDSFITQKKTIELQFVNKLTKGAKAVTAIQTPPDNTVFVLTEKGTITTYEQRPNNLHKKIEFVKTTRDHRGIYCEAPSANIMKKLIRDLEIYDCQIGNPNHETIPGPVGKAANELGIALRRFAIPQKK